MKISINECKEIINNSDMVLVGIGKEFDKDIYDVIKDNEVYQKFGDEISRLGTTESNMVEHAIYYHELVKGENALIKECIDALDKLAEILSDKNYFVVSTCTNSILKYSKIREDRLVIPCGDITKMECNCGCNEEVVDAIPHYEKIYKRLSSLMDGEFDIQYILSCIPYCEKCESPMEPNTFEGLSYQEKGYLDRWEAYQKWLTGTMNKELAILELSVNFETPTVVRWPFEKIAMISNKAKLIRVNDKFAMVTPEIAEKSYTFEMTTKDFIDEIMK